MISDSQQEQVALYALGMLDAAEATAFERDMESSAELRGLVRELRNSVAELALADGVTLPPLDLKGRLLDRIANADKKVLRPRLSAWVPWSIAAAAAIFWMVAATDRNRLSNQYRAYRTKAIQDRLAANARFQRVNFCVLEPTPDAAAQPHAAALWDDNTHQGRLHVNHFAPPADGKDYQLWAIEKDRKEPVSAGVVHLNADGSADLSFKPDSGEEKPVAAVAISVEAAGGSTTAAGPKGPIILLGKFGGR